MISLMMGIDICEHGHESVSGCAACKASNVCSEGFGTLTERALIASDKYKAKIEMDPPKSIT